MQTLADVSSARQSHLFSQLFSKEGNPCQGLGSSAEAPTLTRSEEGHNMVREQQGWSHLTHPSPFLVLCGED